MATADEENEKIASVEEEREETSQRLDWNKVEFKPAFIERYSKLTDWETFKKYSLSYLRKAIRVNTLKATVLEIRKRLAPAWKLSPVPWCKEGFWIEGERRDIGNLPEHILGYLYVQDPASMIPPIVLDPKPGETVLDLCAAPGSKTTQMGQYMKNKGLLVANDVDEGRLAALGLNVQRCGLTNCVITKMEGHWYRRSAMRFDRILVDAPCSATGTIRKSIRTVYDWSPNLVKRVAGQQRSLLETAFGLLKDGGTLVYSTCTLEPEENEGNIHWLLERFPNAKLQKIELDIQQSSPIDEFDRMVFTNEVKKCLRIWPQDNDTEGFFVASILKD
ncbi:RsmB/NOP family class I SAM-dependent RNA methyltransferase [Candidatus Woesearchaeota archaeon]|nr:RsmB/NOP family class I SAM-dependent RNA methyltransferase [Candidatus Woesearchaeota archaeon]